MEKMIQRKYTIFELSEIDKINFEEVLETSKNSVRISSDGTKTFVKWEGDTIPQSISNLLSKEGPYEYEEIMTILSTPEWTIPI